MSFEVCDCQHQHVYLNYFLNLTIGFTEIPTDFHADWYKETKGVPDPLQTPWIGTSFALVLLWSDPPRCIPDSVARSSTILWFCRARSQ